MVSIPLRQYIREIEAMIDGGHNEEAIAHCRHILQTYPKHIQTYRLLGKAYLENQRYADASDIFQRLLAVIPDDFIAHVGMSIIREDENNLDSAIWHMERAFETQPSNAAIQEELRRLFGRRDGMEPPRIRLTRGALARMYARGDLYEQAIAELRAAISEDTQRIDLQVILAQMYDRSGKRLEAIQTCLKLIKKYPYLYEANRLLSTLLPATEHAQSIGVYQQRLVAMDPYYSRLSGEARTPDDVSENLVGIERLEYRAGQPTSSTKEQPAWVSSLGVNLEKETTEQLPDWLQVDKTQELPAEDEISKSNIPPFTWDSDSEPAEQSVVQDVSDETIPDWMREAGWKPASSRSEESSIPFGDSELEDEIAEGVIPDWLKEIAPAGALGEGELDFQERTDDNEIPSLGEDSLESEITQPSVQEENLEELAQILPAPGETDKPIHPMDWVPDDSALSSIDSQSEEDITGKSDQLPQWLLELKGTDKTSEDALDWLPELDDLSKPGRELQGLTEPEEPTSLSIEERELSSLRITEEPNEIIHVDESYSIVDDGTHEGTHTENLEATADTEHDILPSDEIIQDGPIDEQSPESLASLNEVPHDSAASEFSEQLVPEGSKTHFELPEWLRDITPSDEDLASTEAEPSTPEEIAEKAELPDWISGFRPEEAVEKPVDQESATAEEITIPTEFPDWLKEIASGEPEQSANSVEQPVSDTIQEESDVQLWMSGEEQDDDSMGSTSDGLTPNSSEADALSFEEFKTEQEATTSDATPSVQISETPSDQDAALAWLEELASEQQVKEEEILNPSRDLQEMPPGWILEENLPEIGSDESSLTPKSDEPEISIWLDQADQGESTLETQTEESLEHAVTEDIPEWLQEGSAEVASSEGGSEAPSEAVPVEDIPEWLKDGSTNEAIADEITEVKSDASARDEFPSWLQEDIPEELTVEAGTVGSSETTSPHEIPEWLQETNTMETAHEETGEAPPETVATDEIPPWLLDVAEVEQAPGITSEIPSEPMPAEAIPDWLQGEVVEKIDQRDTPEVQIESTIDQEIIQVREDLISETLVHPELAPEITDEDGYEAILADARVAMDSGDCASAITKYTSLVKEGHRLDTIIHELVDATYRFPVDVDLWQTLGDAYMRNDNLQEALDAYSKAEELMR